MESILLAVDADVAAGFAETVYNASESSTDDLPRYLELAACLGPATNKSQHIAERRDWGFERRFHVEGHSLITHVSNNRS